MKKIIIICFIALICVSTVFAVATDGVVDVAESLFNISGTKFTGADGLIAVAIVCFVEFVVKKICKKFNVTDKAWAIVVRLSPIGLGLIVYLITAIIQKSAIPASIIHGFSVGLAASGSYASLVTLFKKVTSFSTAELNQEAIKILSEAKNKE